MKKFFTFLLYFLVIALITGIVIGVSMLLGRPLEEGLLILGLIFGIWLLIVIIRKLIIRHRAKAQVQRILQQENAIIDAELGMSPRQLIKELKKGWNKAVKSLRSSHLKLKGDPLYVLPWYMVFGKPCSGKSTALKNARLLTPSMELSEHADGSTLNLEWWLYDQAIVIDTAGRYAVPDVDKRDKKEWSTLLSMLSRHKQKEPLNGLVLVVAADRLLNGTEEELIEEGKQVRSGINELMEKLEIQMPVYLMVTKCDLIESFTEWCEYLPEDSMRQVMGYLYEDPITDVNEALDLGFDKVLDRLKELRLLMMERSDNPGDSLIELPLKLEALRKGLHIFASSALKNNLYQETPKFRGLYFSSSQQQTVEDGSNKIKNHGLFLNHLFTKVMPPDRGILSTLPSAERIRRAVRNYGMSASGIILITLVMSLTTAFFSDYGALNTLLKNSENISLAETDINQKISSFNRLAELIVELEKTEQNWILPWYGPYNASQQRKKLIEIYTEKFKSEILTTLDNPLSLLAGSVASDKTAYLVSGLVRRINLIQEKLSAEEAGTQVPDIPDEYLTVISKKIDQESAQLFNSLYRRYVTYQSSTIVLSEEQLQLQAVLQNAVYSGRSGYDWLIGWANNQGIKPVKLGDFWGGSRLLKNQPQVEPAFTTGGRAFLQAFLTELESASIGSAKIVAIKENFSPFYQRRYLKSWKEFAEKFDMGKQKLRGRKEWLTALESMTTIENPYFSLMQKIKFETEPVEQEGIFESKEKIGYFTEIQAFVGEDTGPDSTRLKKKAAKTGLRLLSKMGKVGKLAAKAGKTGMKASKKAGKGKKGVDLNAVLEDASKSYTAYKAALLDLAFNVDSSKFSYNSTVSAFQNPEDLSAGDGGGAAAWESIKKLQMILGKPRESTRTFWNLYTGPVRLAYDYMHQESACYLQTSWQDNVLAEIAGVNEEKLAQTLIGESGLVWSYVTGDAAPFLKKKFRKGYVPVKVSDKAMHWNDGFMKYINQSDEGRNIVAGEFTVSVGALPTGINQEATISPYATYLDVHCAEGVQTLANYNYSASKEFNWSLKACGDVSLRIEVGEISLKKQYTGRKGFSKFLAEFRDGRRVFTPKDFPSQASQLLNESVTAIDVNYTFSGQKPVIKMLNTVSLYPPKDAIACWPRSVSK